MFITLVCSSCETAYDEIIVERESSALPPCPQCGAWLLRLDPPVAHAAVIMNESPTATTASDPPA